MNPNIGNQWHKGVIQSGTKYPYDSQDKESRLCDKGLGIPTRQHPCYRPIIYHQSISTRAAPIHHRDISLPGSIDKGLDMPRLQITFLITWPQNSCSSRIILFTLRKGCAHIMGVNPIRPGHHLRDAIFTLDPFVCAFSLLALCCLSISWGCIRNIRGRRTLKCIGKNRSPYILKDYLRMVLRYHGTSAWLRQFAVQSVTTCTRWATQ